MYLENFVWLKDVLRLETRNQQYALAAIIAFIIPLFRLALNTAILRPLASAVFRRRVKQLGKAEVAERIYKWNEAGWKAGYRIVLVAVCLVASAPYNFFLEPSQFWDGCNQFPPCNYPRIEPILRLAFAMELGFYLEAVPYLLFFEVRRKDYLGNVIHHFVTLGLIFYSSQLNFLKVGVAIILCHEVNDIFMECAKMGRYAGHSVEPTVAFVLFASSWVLTRLAYFPAVVIWNIYVEPPKLATLYGLNLTPHREIFLALLSTLLILHAYWSVLIFKIAWTQLTKGELEDIREESTALETSAAEGVAVPAGLKQE